MAWQNSKTFGEAEGSDSKHFLADKPLHRASHNVDPAANWKLPTPHHGSSN
jgi:hypothetical protein